jgi:hypothetical protein
MYESVTRRGGGGETAFWGQPLRRAETVGGAVLGIQILWRTKLCDMSSRISCKCEVL